MKKQRSPPGWTEKQIRELAAYYDRQTEEEQAAEIEAALAKEGQAFMVVPTELVPEIGKLISRKHHAKADRSGRQGRKGPMKGPLKRTTKPRRPGNARKQRFPRGWDEARVRRVLQHYENQTDDEAVAEDEAAYRIEGQTMMAVPTELVPEVRRLIARRKGR
jgi:hypothetical protein